ncbi:MAG TPA: DUF58 domain-containing protein [Armatimonadetes bacterium]|nr:DUF58 domain-containing protein [Armatimonadota bacterium]
MFPSARLAIGVGLVAIGLLLAPLGAGWAWVTLLGNLLLAALVWLDYWWLRQADHCTATRDREEVFSLGAVNPVRVVVRHRGRWPLAIEVADEPPVEFSLRGGRFQAHLLPGETWEGRYEVFPPRRGDYRFGEIKVRFRTRLGLLVRQRSFPAEAAVRVYPNLLDVRKYQLLGRRDLLAQMGVHQRRQRGLALEFEYLREYQPDDELRRVDWKATARRGELIVKEYDVERSQQVLLALDLGRTMASRLGELTKVDLALNACVLLAYVASLWNDRVGLLAFADDIVGYLPFGKGRFQAARVLEFLYPLEARSVETDYRRAFAYLNALCRRRSLVIVFTDLIDPDSSSLLITHLRPLARQHLVLCVALSDYELDEILHTVPREPRDLYEQAVALSLQQDRAQALAALRAGGIRTLNASPQDLSVQVVNRYLALKRKGAV